MGEEGLSNLEGNYGFTLSTDLTNGAEVEVHDIEGHWFLGTTNDLSGQDGVTITFTEPVELTYVSFVQSFDKEYSAAEVSLCTLEGESTEVVELGMGPNAAIIAPPIATNEMDLSSVSSPSTYVTQIHLTGGLGLSKIEYNYCPGACQAADPRDDEEEEGDDELECL